MRDATPWAQFAMLAEGHRRAGMLDQAEQLAQSALDAHPERAEGVIVLALVRLDQGRGDEARELMERWASDHLGVEVRDAPESVAAFDGRVSDGELDLAFDDAETDRDELIDADAIAQQAMLATEQELVDEFVAPNPNFATRTVASLLAQQGDERGASRVRAMIEPPAASAPARARGRNARKIERLERWLAHVRGGVQ